MSIGLYYKINHSLKKHHQWEWSEINKLYPWERDIEIALINEDIEKEEKKG